MYFAKFISINITKEKKMQDKIKRYDKISLEILPILINSQLPLGIVFHRIYYNDLS